MQALKYLQTARRERQLWQRWRESAKDGGCVCLFRARKIKSLARKQQAKEFQKEEENEEPEKERE